MSNVQTIQEMKASGVDPNGPRTRAVRPEQPRVKFPGRGQRLGRREDPEAQMEAEEVPMLLSQPNSDPELSQLEQMSEPDITKSFIESAADLMALAAMSPMRGITPLNRNMMKINSVQAIAADQMINTILRNQRVLERGCL